MAAIASMLIYVMIKAVAMLLFTVSTLVASIGLTFGVLILQNTNGYALIEAKVGTHLKILLWSCVTIGVFLLGMYLWHL